MFEFYSTVLFDKKNHIGYSRTEVKGVAGRA